MVRPTPADAPTDPRGPLETASFPLVPYANRIGNGRFTVDGQPHQLPLNFGDHPHSLHGFGWTAPWTVTQVDAASAMLVHDHAGSEGWPWSYRAQQQIALDENGLSLRLSITNLGDTPMPAGLGFHPYFPLEPGMRLHFNADGLWLSSESLLPERHVAADTLGNWSVSMPVAGDTLIDHCFTGWDGSVTVERADGSRFAVTGDTGYLHFYRPPGEAFFCLEPVSHMPDAINRAEGMAMLEPGAEQALTMRIALDA